MKLILAVLRCRQSLMLLGYVFIGVVIWAFCTHIAKLTLWNICKKKSALCHAWNFNKKETATLIYVVALALSTLCSHVNSLHLMLRLHLQMQRLCNCLLQLFILIPWVCQPFSLLTSFVLCTGLWAVLLHNFLWQWRESYTGKAQVTVQGSPAGFDSASVAWTRYWISVVPMSGSFAFA